MACTTNYIAPRRGDAAVRRLRESEVSGRPRYRWIVSEVELVNRADVGY